jgi:hypothetical protein
VDFVTCGDHVGAVVGHLIPCLSVCLLLLLLGEMGMPPSWANALIAVCVLSVVVYYWKTERMETETIEKPQDASDCTDNSKRLICMFIRPRPFAIMRICPPRRYVLSW